MAHKYRALRDYIAKQTTTTSRSIKFNGQAIIPLPSTLTAAKAHFTPTNKKKFGKSNFFSLGVP